MDKGTCCEFVISSPSFQLPNFVLCKPPQDLAGELIHRTAAKSNLDLFRSLYCEWTDLWAHLRLDGDGLPLLVPLPVQAEGRVRPGGGGVPRLPGPLLLRAPGAMPGVPRAQEPRLRPGDR